MAGKSNYLENALLNYVYRGTAMPAIGGLYLALFTTSPGEDGSGGVEVSGGSYARQNVARNTTEWKDPATGTQGMTENVNTQTYPTASAPWGTIVAAGLYDNPTAGNLLTFGNLASSKIIGTGDVFKFNAGDYEHAED